MDHPFDNPTPSVWHPHVTGFPELPGKGLESQFRSQPYKVVINVSDDPMWANAAWYRQNDIQYYWFPMGDCVNMGLHPIFGAMMVLWEAERQGLKALVHCAAGINRSQTVMDCYHFMSRGCYRTWQPPIETIKVNWGDGDNGRDSKEIQWRSMLARACNNPAKGYKSLAWIEKWLVAVRHQLDTHGLQAGTFDSAYLAAENE